MFKKFMLGAALSLTLVGGGIAASSSSPVAITTSVSQSAPAVQLLSTVPAPAGVQVAPLSRAEMGVVQGDGNGWWQKFKKWAKKVIKKVVGVIVQEIIEALKDWLEEFISDVSGGEEQKATDVQTRDYASQYDYEIDNAYADNTEYGAWEQTSVWYSNCSDPTQVICE